MLRSISLLLVPVLAHGAAAAVTDEQVDQAMARMQQFFFDTQDPGSGGWEYDFIDHTHHGGGETAIVTLSLLASGQTQQDPRIKKALRYLAGVDMNGTYAVSLRAHCWAALPDRYLSQLDRDAQWLLGAHHESLFDYGPVRKNRVDHSVTQYGVLGLWEFAKRGGKTPRGFWADAARHFLRTQQVGGGWTYGGATSTKATGSMTAAGLTVLLVAQQELHRTRQKPDAELAAAIDKGLAWLDKRFTGSKNPGGNGNVPYFLYGLERVALAAGIKNLNGRDWFAAGAEGLIAMQHESGSITAHGGRHANTAFALMFLSRGRVPVWINKIKVPGQVWNNRPNDIYFFTKHLSDVREAELNWQVVDINSDPAHWLSAPVAFLASDEAIELDPDQLSSLNRYIDLGGLLVASPDLGNQRFSRSIEDLGRQMYPDYPMRFLEPDHPAINMIYDTSRNRRQRIRGVSNGARDLIILATRDWGMRFQADDPPGQTDPWRILTNIYAMVTGRGTLDDRLVIQLLARSEREATGPIRLVRAVYAGNWNPEPVAWLNLSSFLFNRTGKQLTVGELPLDQIGSSDASLVHLAGVEPIDLTDDEVEALHSFVAGGGTVLVETVGGRGRFSVRIAERLTGTFDRAPLPLEADEPIISGRGLDGGFDNRRVVYRPFSVINLGARSTPRLLAFGVDGRPAIILAHQDLSLGLIGVRHWPINGYQRASARRLVTNILLAARRAP